MKSATLRLAIVGAAISLAAGCGTAPEIEAGPDASVRRDAGGADGGACITPCDEACCEPGEACVLGVCQCQPDCDGRECGSNGCGGSCGACQGAMSCALATGRCEFPCTPESNTEFCARLKKNCGSVTGKDNCGEDRTRNCGSCAYPATCSMLTNVCSCDAETDDELCYQAGRVCGPLTVTDGCDQSREIASCGLCRADQTCAEATGTCVTCTAESDQAFCQRLNKRCGTVTGQDSCGMTRTASCGTCASPTVCGEDNTCATPGAPANDTCTNPVELSLGVAVTGDTTLASALYGTSGLSTVCANKFWDWDYDYGWEAVGRELVYSYTPVAAGSFTVEVRPSTSGYDPLVWITAGNCGSAGSCLNGADDRLGGGTESMSVSGVAGTTYFIYVDSGYEASKSTGMGAFTLTVR